MSVRLRLAAALVGAAFVLTACGGGGGKSLLGGTVPGGSSGSAGQTSRGNVQFTLTIPNAASTSSVTRRTAQSISSQTQSITVSVDGGAPLDFNAAAPTCTGTNPLTCTLSVGAPYGLDSFLILTYSGTSGTGTILNAAAVTLSVTSGGTNTASTTAGNVLIVNNATDASGGSYSCAGGTTTCTLREAVAEASTTAGVFTAILFQGVTSIALTSPIQIGSSGAQNIILIGPGATAANAAGIGAPQASSGLTISGGNATQILYVNSGSLMVDGMTLANGSAADGGAIENTGVLALVNTIFSQNGGPSTFDGGAVYDDSATSDTTTVIASTFTNNTSAGYGGAYYDEDGASFSHCLFTTNTSFNSGEDYGEGGAIFTDGDLSVDTSTFTNNVAGSTTASGVSGYGGAIYLDDEISMSPSITNSTFGGSASTGNFAGGAGPTDDAEGGAIYNDGSYPLTLSGDTFAYNIAEGGGYAEGGAISDYLGITSTGDTFTNNVANATAATSEENGDVYGGAVATTYNSGSSWTGDTFTGNQAEGGGSAVIYGQAIGGAIAVYNDSAAVDFTASQTTFSNNSATAGQYCEGAGVDDEDYYGGGSVSLTNVQFTNNTCTANNGSASQESVVYGGGLFDVYDYVALSSVSFSGNIASSTDGPDSAYSYGGGFEWEDGVGSEEESIARRVPAALAAKSSGTSLSLQSRVSVQQKIHAQALAHHQALRSNAHVPPKAAHFIASLKRTPKATARRILQLSSSSLQNVTFSANSATASSSSGTSEAFGGGAELSGQPTFSGVSFTNNSATASGADPYGAGGGFDYGDEGCASSLTFTGTVTGNTAANAGGGILNYCNGFTILQSTISANKVTAVAYSGDGGGGIQNYEGGLSLVQSTVSGNSVAGSTAGAGGGGVMNYDGGLTIANSTIYGNASSIDGGGLENADYGTVTTISTTVYQNTATGVGGNLNNQNSDGSGVVTSQNTIIAGGTASSQPDIYNADTFTSQGYNLVQQSSNYGPGTSNAPLGTDIVGQAPLLGGLSNNGGPTLTVGDSLSSPGRAVIPFSGGLCNGAPGTSVDQRGYARGSGGKCDIGAFELGGTAP